MKISLAKLSIITIVLFIASLGVLFYHKYKYGELFPKDIDLKGGTLITINTNEPVDADKLENYLLKKFPDIYVTGFSSAGGFGVDIETSENTNVTEIIDSVKDFGVKINSYEVESIGSTLGKSFFYQVTELLLVAYILMAITVFALYKDVVPSLAIIFASAGDVITTLAVATLLGIKISFAGFAALLMIAYAVDTNVILTTKLLKTKKENFYKVYKTALITGITITLTTIVTMVVTQAISTSRMLVNMAQLLTIGFIADIFYTWIFNAGMLELDIKRKKK